MLDWDARALGVLLGLGDLNWIAPCMRYQNGCCCKDCLERQKTPAPAPIKQPWEIAA